MSLNSLAPAFLPRHQSSSDPPLSLCNSNTMNLPLAQLICGMPPQITPSHAPSINQPIADNTLLLPFLQPINQYTKNAAAHKTTPGSSTHWPSSLHHQMKCLQAINNSIQQFNQHLKSEKLDRQILQLVVLQLQNDFAVLRYLLFSSTETLPNKDITAKDAATSPLIDTNAKPNPNANPNPNPSSQLPSAFSLPGPRSPTLRRSTPVGAVGTAKTKTNNTANNDFQPIPNTQDTTIQNLTSRICKLEKLFANEVSTYTSITAGVHSQYFLLYDKIRQLEPGNSDVIIWKISSVKFVFDSAKVARPSSDPLIEPATSFSSPISGPIRMATISSSNSTRMVSDPLLVSVLRFYSHSSRETMTIFCNGPSQRPSILVFETSWTQ